MSIYNTCFYARNIILSMFLTIDSKYLNLLKRCKINLGRRSINIFYIFRKCSPSLTLRYQWDKLTYILPFAAEGLSNVMLMFSLGSCLMLLMVGGELGWPEERVCTDSDGGDCRGLQSPLCCRLRN